MLSILESCHHLPDKKREVRISIIHPPPADFHLSSHPLECVVEYLFFLDYFAKIVASCTIERVLCDFLTVVDSFFVHCDKWVRPCVCVCVCKFPFQTKKEKTKASSSQQTHLLVGVKSFFFSSFTPSSWKWLHTHTRKKHNTAPLITQKAT